MEMLRASLTEKSIALKNILLLTALIIVPLLAQIKWQLFNIIIVLLFILIVIAFFEVEKEHKQREAGLEKRSLAMEQSNIKNEIEYTDLVRDASTQIVIQLEQIEEIIYEAGEKIVQMSLINEKTDRYIMEKNTFYLIIRYKDKDNNKRHIIVDTGTDCYKQLYGDLRLMQSNYRLTKLKSQYSTCLHTIESELVGELKDLVKMKQAGRITENEYYEQKEKMLQKLI